MQKTRLFVKIASFFIASCSTLLKKNHDKFAYINKKHYLCIAKKLSRTFRDMDNLLIYRKLL